MTPSPLAYALAHHINAWLCSDIVQQNTMDMPREEFLEYLAREVMRVLVGHAAKTRHRPPTKLAVGQDCDEAPKRATLTDAMARQMLENAPPEAKAAYGKAIRNNVAVADAVDAALAVLRRLKEDQAVSQVA